MVKQPKNPDMQSFSRYLREEVAFHDLIAEALWDEPMDFLSIVSAIRSAGYATTGFSALMFLALDQLMTMHWVVKRHGLFCLTPLGRKCAVRHRTPRFTVAELN